MINSLIASKKSYFDCFGYSAGEHFALQMVMGYGLVANFSGLQTTIDLTRIFPELDHLGHQFTRADVNHITPLITSHIKRFGDFSIHLNPTVTLMDIDMLLPASIAEET